MIIVFLLSSSLLIVCRATEWSMENLLICILKHNNLQLFLFFSESFNYMYITLCRYFIL